MSAKTDAVPKQSTSAARTRAYRLRKSEGSVLVHLNISANGVRALQALGWISPSDESNPKAITNAILAAASAALSKGLRGPAAISGTTRGKGSAS